MKTTKGNNPITLDYLGLDKCKNNAEQAAILWAEIVRRNSELKQVKKAYQNVYNNIVRQWKDEITDRFPGLKMILAPSCGDIVVEFSKDSCHYEVGIGKARQNLLCLVRLRLDDIHNGAVMTDEFVLKFNGLLSKKTCDNYCMFSEFNMNDLETAISCYIQVVERFVELTQE